MSGMDPGSIEFEITLRRNMEETGLNIETIKSSSQSLRIQELFKACDTKGTGSIGPPEFSDLCKKFGIADKDSHVIFIDLDHDGDGKISFEDFTHGFSDFLTPGSRRGSFQVNLTNGNSNAIQQLMDMEKRHASAKRAWKNFVQSVGKKNVASFLKENNCTVDLKFPTKSPNISKDVDGDGSVKLEAALTSLISDVQTLHDEYKTLEASFRKEREAHAIQLAALGEELDNQLAKAESKAKDEARMEAQRQMDAERKKITQEMEVKLNELTAQIKTFEKVEEWLVEEENRGKSKNFHDSNKHIETESENRKLRSALVEAQMNATLLQSQLTQKRNEYLDLYQELHTEKVTASEYRNQCDLMQNHLSILSQANRVLSDANDCFSSSSSGIRNQLPLNEEMHDSLESKSAKPALKHEGKENSFIPKFGVNFELVSSLPRTYHRSPQKRLSQPDLDRDSGTDTLFEELRAESESSPLPSGRWSEMSSPTPEGSPVLNAKSKQDSPPKDNALSVPAPPSPIPFQTLNPLKHLPERTFKVILAGDAAVGKTSFIERACHGHFATHLSSTIGVDFRVKLLEIDGRCIALQLWDTAGQERFRSLTKSYFRRADGVILVYDVASEQTFLSIRHWMQNVEEGAGRKLPIVICGNKVDLRADWQKGGACISHDEGLKMCREYGTLFIEVSPKTGFNVQEALLLLTKEMSLVEDAELRSSVRLNDFDEKGKKRACCGSGTSPDGQRKIE